MKPFFDAIIVVPLEEEFQTVLEHFTVADDLSTDTQIMISATVSNSNLSILLAKQVDMGKARTISTSLACLEGFDTGLMICLGIAGGISSDVSIGDVCCTGSVLDVLDNAKISDSETSQTDIALSPTTYSSSKEISVAIELHRLFEPGKSTHAAWAAERGRLAKELLPDQFHGKEGNMERISSPKVHGGPIACGLVSASPGYNKKLKNLNRKILAVETESGGLFLVAEQYRIDALSIRGISDYAGMDKNRFELETKNKGRKIAASNAASYLVIQLSNKKLLAQLQKKRNKNTGTENQLSLLEEDLTDRLQKVLIELDEEINERLRELAPAYELQKRGYRLPVPRVRVIDTRGIGPQTQNQNLSEVRAVLKYARILTIHVPREYPDDSLSWVLALDLLHAELGDKKIIPKVIEGSHLRAPKNGLRKLAGHNFQSVNEMEAVQPVFVIDNFDFTRESRLRFLKEEIDASPSAKFIVVTRCLRNAMLESEFTKNISSCTSTLSDVSFVELSYFLQKNFEMNATASEVVAMRLHETFKRYALSAHPSYFAGIPKSTLSTLLQVNRRAELIQLAVAGYLSFVVAEDEDPIRLSRTTRESFLAELSLKINVEKLTFTEAQLIKFAEEMSNKFDYSISPTKFVSLFIDKHILHVEDGLIKFTLPFIESYLLAVRLRELPSLTDEYFSTTKSDFDYRTFTLYAELGPSSRMVESISRGLDASMALFKTRAPQDNALLDHTIRPAILAKYEQLGAVQQRIRQAAEDVVADREQSSTKQAILDAADRVRQEAGSELQAAGLVPSILDGGSAINVMTAWSVAVTLLGSGAERLEATTKREMVRKIVKLSSFIADEWMRSHKAVNFDEIRKTVLADSELIKRMSKSESAEQLSEVRKLLDSLVDFAELFFLLQPLTSVAAFLCEEARDPVLVESISNTDVPDGIEDLILNLWLTDIHVQKGKKRLIAAIKNLPKVPLLRHTITTHLLSRVYWRHWKKQDRLDLLDAASESLKSIGVQQDKSRLKRLLEDLTRDEDLLPGK
jgi:nucleoside phosphorylase